MPYWFKLQRARDLDAGTLSAYERILVLHALPTLGRRSVRTLRSADVLALCADKLTTKALGRSSIKFLLAVLSSVFQRALADGLLKRNPCEKLGKELNLGRSRGDKEDVKALSRAERDTLLETIAATRPRLYAPTLCMTHGGLRIGEVAGLEWADCDLDPARRTLTVGRTYSKRKLKATTKSGAARTVRMTVHLRDTLARLAVEQKKEALRTGQPVPTYMFPSALGTRLDVRAFERAFKRALRDAHLPPHHSPHTGRHSFATLLLRAGVPLEYVKRQLGHASIAMTADTYGRWLPDSDEPAWTPKAGQFWVDVLDTPAGNGSNVVATGTVGAE